MNRIIIYTVVAVLALSFASIRATALAAESPAGAEKGTTQRALASPADEEQSDILNTPVPDLLTYERRPSSGPPDSGDSFQLIAGRASFSTATVSASSPDIYVPPAFGFARLECETSNSYNVRLTAWSSDWRNLGYAWEVGNLSINARNTSGSSASASLLTSTFLLLYKAELFRNSQTQRAILTPYAGLGLIAYIAELDVWIVPEFYSPVSGYVYDISFPDIRAGLQWNLGENSSFLIEWRYMDLDIGFNHAGSDFMFSSHESAEMSVEGSVVSIGGSWKF